MPLVRRRGWSGVLAIVLAGAPLQAQGSTIIDADVAAAHFPDDDTWLVGPFARLTLARETGGTRLTAGSTLVANGLGQVGGAGEVSALWRAALGTDWSLQSDATASALFGSSTRGGAATQELTTRL